MKGFKPVGPESTTGDWQRLERPWAVLPVGSTEQHGSHLPLCTDVVEAEHFARLLAHDLNAGLLPAVPILHSYEQTGFRGSLSLGLETGIAMLKDIAEQLQSQGFTRLIIVNFHGGNHILKPVAKDINRRDKPLKVIVVNGWEYDSSPEGRALGRAEIHAGAWETSLMLAIRPELVGDYASSPASTAITEAVQDDLGTFGIGRIRPDGPWGDPSRSDPDAGRIIAESIHSNIADAVRKRLSWLNDAPSYGGPGPIAFRALRSRDIPAGLELCRIAGWNQKEADWSLLLSLNPEGCFAAVHNGRIIGTAVTADYESLSSWIGLVIVHPSFRNRGIGKKLLSACLEALDSCACVKLDATPAGKPLYAGLGFTEEYGLVRMFRPVAEGNGNRGRPQAAGALKPRPMTEEDLAIVIKFDTEAFGAPRAQLLKGMFRNAPEYAWVVEAPAQDPGKILGYCLGRRGENFEQIGPVQARDLETAEALFLSALSCADGKAAGSDILLRDPAWQERLEALGFTAQRQLTRMYRGKNNPGKPEMQFATTGPEAG